MEIKPTYVSIPFEEWEEYQKMKIENKETVKPFELEVGKDYVAKQNKESIIIDRKGDYGNVGFLNGVFFNDISCLNPETWREATEEEVIEAFEKECVRRLGEDWREVKLKAHSYKGRASLNTGDCTPLIMKDDLGGWIVWNKNGCVYYDGKWAEKLEEPKFAENLEDVDRPWYLSECGEVEEVSEKAYQDKNHLPTEELTEGLLALTQLLSFRHDVWEKEGKPQDHEGWHGIVLPASEEDFRAGFLREIKTEFRFKKKETAEWFLETHKELLTEYFNKIIKQ